MTLVGLAWILPFFARFFSYGTKQAATCIHVLSAICSCFLLNTTQFYSAKLFTRSAESSESNVDARYEERNPDEAEGIEVYC